MESTIYKIDKTGKRIEGSKNMSGEITDRTKEDGKIVCWLRLNNNDSTDDLEKGDYILFADDDMYLEEMFEVIMVNCGCYKLKKLD